MKPAHLREARGHALVSGFGVETVEMFFTQGDEDGAAIIMEDLAVRGACCLRTIEPITEFKVMADFLEAAARIHAVWWDRPEVADDGPFSWIWGLRVHAYTSGSRDPEQFAATMALPRAMATPAVLKDAERLLAAIPEVMTNRPGLPITVVHGDLNLSNLYLTSDRAPGFLDWTLRRLPWAMDVAYFIAGALDVVDRRRWERTLLQHYLECLAQGVDAPSFDDAWDASRAWMIWGEMTWLPNRTDFHTEAACTAMASRFGHAMVDLDTFGALGV
jgi:hypothetical protein